MQQQESEISVSVIIPAYNEELYLDQCLQSLARMESHPARYQVIVVDNGSRDQTPQVARRYGATLVDYPEGRSIAAVRNKGASVATGSVLAFLDADCVVSPHWLAGALRALQGGVRCVGSRPVAPDSGATWVQRCWGQILPRSLDQAVPVDWLSSSNLIVCADSFHQVGGFDERLQTGEDVDLGIRLSRRVKILYDPAVKAFHLKEPRTLICLIKKEIWHGKSNFRGFVSHGFPLSEALSVLLPLVFLVSLLLVLFGAFFQRALFLAGLFVVLSIPGVMTLRNMKRTKLTPVLFQCFAINISYILGRSISIVPSLVDLLTVRRPKREQAAPEG